MADKVINKTNPRRKNGVSLLLSDEEIAAWREAATSAELSLSDWIRRTVKVYLKKHRKDAEA